MRSCSKKTLILCAHQLTTRVKRPCEQKSALPKVTCLKALGRYSRVATDSKLIFEGCQYHYLRHPRMPPRHPSGDGKAEVPPSPCP